MDVKTAFSEIVKKPKQVTLLKAPTGWGKTSLVWDLLETNSKIIVVSPLKSLIHELSEKSDTYHFLEGKKEEVIKSFWKAQKGILVVTAESLPLHLMEPLISELDPLIVLDEFHLFFKWGQDFRPHLQEFFENIICLNSRVLALSATVEKEIEDCLIEDLSRNSYELTSIDIGNFKNARPPKKVRSLSKSSFYGILKLSSLSLSILKGRTLIFVKTKSQGRALSNDLRNLGIRSALCFGGEVMEFVERERRYKEKVIIATSALSHGVNIEDITRVFINYEPSKDMMHQMIARGGRRGQKFNVYLLKEGRQMLNLSGYFSNLLLGLV